MQKILSATLLASATLALPAHAYQASQLHGTWCFYEQSAAGNSVPEQVTITLKGDGSYQWSEPAWKQQGSWKLDGDVLDMSNVGRHRLTSVGSSKLEMVRGSSMRWRKGACR